MSEAVEKTELRRLVRLTRAARSVSELGAAEGNFDALIQALITDHDWSRIAAFIPTPTEPPISLALDHALEHNIDVIVPESTPQGLLDWIRLEPGFRERLTSDSMGMPVPDGGAREDPVGVEALLIPAAAVDRDGNRLGWGKGYYDRFLQTISPATVVVAVVFESDVFSEIPCEAHDQPVDLIVTEENLFRVQ